MGTITVLPDRSRERDEQRFREHRQALVRLVVAFATHSESGEGLDELEAASTEFVRAYIALGGQG